MAKYRPKRRRTKEPLRPYGAVPIPCNGLVKKLTELNKAARQRYLFEAMRLTIADTFKESAGRSKA